MLCLSSWGPRHRLAVVARLPPASPVLCPCAPPRWAVPSPVLAHLWWPMMALWVRGCEKPVEKRSTTT